MHRVFGGTIISLLLIENSRGAAQGWRDAWFEQAVVLT